MDILTPSERSARMSLIRCVDTKPELFVRRLVHGLGFRYRLHVRELPGCPDLVFKSRAKVIFVHGCFWHLHRNCENNRPPKSRVRYWKPKLERNATRDKLALRQLKRCGWKSLVIWECEIGNPTRVAKKLQDFLAS
jgi:DNA mismatch endonuclease (patch repair protein)